ncbi:MAG: DUF975 family protein [Oscillospiraceae bacterium]|nr:DUF975 family protein [Oscillospiraceae bacterium]
MVFIYDRKTIKKQAKKALRVSVPHFMLVVLVYVLLTTGVEYLFDMLSYGGGFFSGVVATFAIILLYLFSMVLAIGFANYALRLTRGESTGISGLFEGFSFTGRSLGVEILTLIFIFLWTLLVFIIASIVTSILMTLAAMAPLVLAVILYVICGLVYVAALILCIFLAIRYDMAPFALVEDPERKSMDCIRRSRTMMKKNQSKLFWLRVSFIGWILLIFLIFVIFDGIGILVMGPSQLADQLNEILSGTDYTVMMTDLDNFVYDIEYQLRWWSVLGEVVALPLILWLTAYMKSAAAVFYNFVSGYDFHQYMNTPVDEIDAPDDYYRSPSDDPQDSGQDGENGPDGDL